MLNLYYWFQMLQILRGQVFRGHMKYPCIFCEFDAYHKDRYTCLNWPARTDHIIGQKNVVNTPLVEKNRICLPVLHIKLGIFKQFIKYLDKNSDAFHTVVNFFPS